MCGNYCFSAKLVFVPAFGIGK